MDEKDEKDELAGYSRRRFLAVTTTAVASGSLILLSASDCDACGPPPPPTCPGGHVCNGDNNCTPQHPNACVGAGNDNSCIGSDTNNCTTTLSHQCRQGAKNACQTEYTETNDSIHCGSAPTNTFVPSCSSSSPNVGCYPSAQNYCSAQNPNNGWVICAPDWNYNMFL